MTSIVPRIVRFSCFRVGQGGGARDRLPGRRAQRPRFPGKRFRLPGKRPHYPFFILRSAFLSVDAFWGVFVYPVDDFFGAAFSGKSILFVDDRATVYRVDDYLEALPPKSTARSPDNEAGSNRTPGGRLGCDRQAGRGPAGPLQGEPSTRRWSCGDNATTCPAGGKARIVYPVDD